MDRSRPVENNGKMVICKEGIAPIEKKVGGISSFQMKKKNLTNDDNDNDDNWICVLCVCVYAFSFLSVKKKTKEEKLLNNKIILNTLTMK